MGTLKIESERDLFESLVDELLKSKPDTRKIKMLCGKLGLPYVKNQADQIDDLIRNGSKVYLKSTAEIPAPKLNHAKSL